MHTNQMSKVKSKHIFPLTSSAVFPLYPSIFPSVYYPFYFCIKMEACTYLWMRDVLGRSHQPLMHGGIKEIVPTSFFFTPSLGQKHFYNQ